MPSPRASAARALTIASSYRAASTWRATAPLSLRAASTSFDTKCRREARASIAAAQALRPTFRPLP